MKSLELEKDIFAVELSDGEYMIYAPLADIACLCNGADLEEVRRALSDNESTESLKEFVASLRSKETLPKANYNSPDEYSKITILPNYTCNLSCSYCYSAKGRSSKSVDPAHLQSALSFLIKESKSRSKERGVFFSGGGEPLLSWDKIKMALDYAYNEAAECGVDLDVHFMSNGTIFKQEVADYIKQHSATICISYEILDDLQNKHRGKSGTVATNINNYLESGVELLISATITPDSVKVLPDMVEELHRRFPKIVQLTMEPVTEPSLFESAYALQDFYDTFDRNYEKAAIIAKECGISLHTSMIGISSVVVDRYCPGKLCLTPMGTFTICHCASSPNEARYEKCQYGYIDDNGKVCFDIDKFKTLTATNYNAYSRCTHCFAKYNCGGECMTRQDIYPAEYMDIVCRHTQKRLIKELQEHIEDGQE